MFLNHPNLVKWPIAFSATDLFQYSSSTITPGIINSKDVLCQLTFYYLAYKTFFYFPRKETTQHLIFLEYTIILKRKRPLCTQLAIKLDTLRWWPNISPIRLHHPVSACQSIGGHCGPITTAKRYLHVLHCALHIEKLFGWTNSRSRVLNVSEALSSMVQYHHTIVTLTIDRHERHHRS